MPWKDMSIMGQRREFAELAAKPGRNMSELCRRFGITRPTGYKWADRYDRDGREGLKDRSRRPDKSPNRTCSELEDKILAAREEYPCWGGRKLKKILEERGIDAPAPSTITEILKRNGLIDPEEGSKHTAFTSFEMAHPNDLWQMDFKGHVACPEGRCHPLTVLDDYSRYCVALKACSNEKAETVKEHLTAAFRHNGLPVSMLMDNGSPWGSDGKHRFTALTVWLMRLDIKVIHSRPYHPQTLGKDERFHRTLKAELVGNWIPWDIDSRQKRFDEWRMRYNCERPHESLDMNTPMSRFHPSPRPFPETVPPIEYDSGSIVRKVDTAGRFSFLGMKHRAPKGFIGLYIMLRPRPEHDGVWDVFFGRNLIVTIDLNQSN